jgi:hydroxymethylpyrimidine pyrophosphatase-like HAD family hydrolase
MNFNPLIDFRCLSSRLTDLLAAKRKPEDEQECVLNAFLLVAGLHQILEDYLHRQSPLLVRTAVRFHSFDHPVASAAASLAGAAATVGASARMWRPRERRLARGARELAELLETTATAVTSNPAALERAEREWQALRPALDKFPRVLLDTTARLPNPFATFDQRPVDCAELMRRFAERWPERERPLLVLGIRTSGTYLAPLCKALLLEAGYRNVQLLTVRAGQRWRAAERTSLAAVAGGAGLALIVDDPPKSGSVVAGVARECVAGGISAESIVLILQLFGETGSMPDALRGYASVVLPRSQWAIEERLSATSVRDVLTRLLPGREVSTARRGTIRVTAVEAVERADLGPPKGHERGRARARYHVVLVDRGGERVEHDVYVRGMGIGYFAGYPRAVVEQLQDYLPELYGIEEGLFYRAWLPGEWRLLGPRSEGLERRIASYVLRRREALAIDPGFAVRATDQYASWDLIADILGWGLMGKLRMLVAPLTWAAARRLTAAERPSLVDGRMGAADWFAPPAALPAEAALKAEPDESTFANAARLTYDALFDLASAGASFDVQELLAELDTTDEPAFSERLLDGFRALSRESVDPERWFLYQVLHNRTELARLFAVKAGGNETDGTAGLLLATERALAATAERYIADIYLGDLAPPETGPLCALDVDWVLETRWLDFPILTPSGAIALRALIRHGCRPVLATGRALGELRTRTRIYRLAGGVGEYGAVLYDQVAKRVTSQLSSEQEAALTGLRAVLRDTSGVHVDHAYRYGVRAIRLVDGRRRRLDDGTIAAALATAGVEDSVQVHYGHLQTDFAPVSVDKGTGLRALARELGGAADEDRPFAFAIGDDVPDIPMLQLAAQRFAPANASRALRDRLSAVPGIEIVGRPQGAGLLQAVASFLGHDPRRCGVCAVPQPSARKRLVTIPLEAADATRLRRLAYIANFAALLVQS